MRPESAAADQTLLVFREPAELIRCVATCGLQPLRALGACRVFGVAGRALVAVLDQPLAAAAAATLEPWLGAGRATNQGILLSQGPLASDAPLAVEVEGSGADLLVSLPLLPGNGGAATPEVACFVAHTRDALGSLVSALLELGHPDAAVGPWGGEADPAWAVRVASPSRFFLERPPPGVTAFARLPGGEIFTEWGFEHPLARFLAAPKPGRCLVINRHGVRQRVELSCLEPLESLLEVRVDVGDGVGWTMDTKGPPRLEVALRLGTRGEPAAPELYVVEADQLPALERLCGLLRDEDLQNLVLAAVTLPTGDHWLLLRELVGGRTRNRVTLPGRPFAAQPGMPQLFVPAARILEPPLRPALLSQALGLEDRCLVVVDDGGDQGMVLRHVPEDAFGPVSGLVDYVVASHAERLEQVVAAAVFDPGDLATQELVVVTAAGAQASLRQPAEVVASQATPPAAGASRPGLLGRVMQVLTPAAEEPAAPAVAAATGVREERDRPPPASPVLPADPLAELVTRACGEGREDVAAWRDLARELGDQALDGDGLACWEAAWWLAPPEQSADILAELRDLLGRGRGLDLSGGAELQQLREQAAGDVATLVLKTLVVSDACGGGEAASPQELASLMADLESAAGSLRKKTRWLLWRAALAAAGDQVEEERRREELLADLARQGVGEREVPLVVRRWLAEHSGRRWSAATAERLTQTGHDLETLLSGVETLVTRGLTSAGHQSHGLAMLAMAQAEVGATDASRDLAARALALLDGQGPGSPPAVSDPEQRALTLGSVAAARALSQGETAGMAQFEQALASARQAPGPTRQATVSGLAAVLARGFLPGTGGELLGRSLTLLDDAGERVAAAALQKAAAPAQRLGAGHQVRRRARALLTRGLPALFLASAVEALEITAESETTVVSPDEADLLLGWLERWRRHEEASPLAAVDVLDEYTVRIAEVALACGRRSPREAGPRLVRALETRGEAYGAVLVRTALVRALSLKRLPQEAAEELQRALGPVFDLRDPLEMIRALRRLVEAIPGLGDRASGTALLRKVLERSAEMEVDADSAAYVRGDILGACVRAAAQLGESLESARLIDAVAAQSLAALERPSRRGYLLLEVLEQAVHGAVAMGQSDRVLELLERIDHASRRFLARDRSNVTRRRATGSEGEVFYAARLLARCAAVAAELGDEARSEQMLEAAMGGLEDCEELTGLELALALVQAAAHLPAPRRFEVASRVVRQVVAVVEPVADYAHREVCGLVAACAREVVGGESAYAGAVKRWRGDEERLIRDRVIRERIVSGDMS